MVMGHMMPGGKSGGKVNVSAMQSNLDRSMKAAKNKERLLANLEKRKAEKASASLSSAGIDNSGRESLVFSTGEQVERSVKMNGENNSSIKKKKNKKKKKKNNNPSQGESIEATDD